MNSNEAVAALKNAISAALLTMVATSSFAAEPSSNLAGQAQAGRLPTFQELLSAKFDTAKSGEFAAFQTWATTRSARESQKWSREIILSDGKRRTVPIGCHSADSRGRARAMLAAIDNAPTREIAEKSWSEAVAILAGARLKARHAAAAVPKDDGANGRTMLGRELARRVGVDQAWRAAQFEQPLDPTTTEVVGWLLWPPMCRSDNANTDYLKMVVQKNGWPTISQYGPDTADDAWLIAQHSDDQPDFQEKALALMSALLPSGEVNKKKYAFLFDRVAIANGRHQRYGTQFDKTPAECIEPLQLENPGQVDALRKSVGLNSISEYAKQLEDNMHVKAC